MSYDPTIAEWTSEDPAGYVGGPNLYQFVGSNPLANTDFSGLQAFWLNRSFSAKPGTPVGVKSGYNVISHSFIYTADVQKMPIKDCDGNITGYKNQWVLRHTYSWGDNGTDHWYQDQIDDVSAAQQAIQSNNLGTMEGVDDPHFDSAVQSAYNVLSTTPSEVHSNLWWFFGTQSCKTEANYLIELALQYYSVPSK